MPDQLPEVIPSPANVLDEWQTGDCFDFAIVLCSLLIGVGYNAYVVYGTAPKEITTKDESDMICPENLIFDDLMEDEDHKVDKDEEQMIERVVPEPEPMTNGFSVETKEPHKSVWDNETSARLREEARLAELAAKTIDDDEKDYEKPDKYGKSRIHAWVLILRPDREMNENLFIEPTTGRTYALESAPYYSIEAIFNHKNFYINLDPTLDVSELLPLDFKDDSTGLWEYVMLEPGNKKDGDDEEQEDQDEDEDDDEGELEEEPLDMPPPWSPKLFVNKDKFLDMCPNGEKTVFYRKCKVEIFSECRQVDGLVKRITLYKDYKRLITEEIRSFYKCRKDKLVVRRRFPYDFKLIEHYESSLAMNHWKKLIRIDGRYRKLYFYHHRQKDGLILREEFFDAKNKIIEEYKNRPDKLIYRSVTFAPNGERSQQSVPFKENNYNKEVLVNKMTQKFELDPDLPAANQIKKTEFNVNMNQVFIYYHYEEGKITARDEEWDRGDLIGHANLDQVNDKDQEDSKEQQIKTKYHDLENLCISQIISQEVNMSLEIQARNESEQAINQLRNAPNPEEIFGRILEKSIYAKARDKMKQGKKNLEDDTAKDVQYDFLLPILKKLGFNEGTQPLEEEAAIQVKNEALRSLKERLLTRATIIQRRLDQE